MGLTLNSNSLALEVTGGAAAGLTTANVNTLIKNSTPYQHISTLEASASASLDFDDIPAYSSYKVIFDGLMPELTSAYAWMRLYKTAGTPHTVSDYYFNVNYSRTGNSFGYDNASRFEIAYGNHFQYGLTGELELSRSTNEPSILRWSLGAGSGSNSIRYDGAGYFNDVAQIKGMQFLPSSNVWRQGKVHVYGVNR